MIVPLPTGFFVLGSLLALVSLLNLSIYLQPNRDDIEKFVSRNIKLVVRFSFLLFLVMLFNWFTGTFMVFRPGEITRFFMDVGAIGLWVVLFTTNSITIFNLVKNGYRPVICQDSLNIVFYMAVLYLVLEKFSMPLMIVELVLALFLVTILYLLFTLSKYAGMLERIVEPVNIHPLALGFRVFSLIVGLQFMSLSYSRNAFIGLMVISYLFFMVVIWYMIKKLKLLIDFNEIFQTGSI
jgi:hypothetical protein